MPKNAGIAARNRAFTLIELMITVAIIGILAAIAFPSYRGYVLRANRTVAKTFMTEIVSKQESFRSDRKVFADVLTKLGFAANTLYLKSDGSTAAVATGAVYSLVLGNATAVAYTLTATPLNSQTQDAKCGTLSLTGAGIRSASGTSGAACWGR